MTVITSSCFPAALKEYEKKPCILFVIVLAFDLKKPRKSIVFVRLTSLVLFVSLSSNYWFASRTDGPGPDRQRVVRFCLPSLCSISSIDLIIQLTEKVFFDYVRLPNSSEL